MVSPNDLPRWRGFNLTAKIAADDEAPFQEEAFAWMADWGFDFARLPMDYRCWTGEDWLDVDEDTLTEIDAAIEYGRQHGVHVNLNFHRAPGFTVSEPPEPTDLWTDEDAQHAFATHWETFARRYEGVPSDVLSFDLVNEPAGTTHEAYASVVRQTVAAIHDVDPDRLVIADGMQYGREPVHRIAELPVAQSTRGYDPMQLTHYMAPWVDGERWAEPDWPLENEDGRWDKQRLRAECIDPWRELEAAGVGIHVGEWGVYSHTPRDVALAWMEDMLELWEEAGWGWALWNLQGEFGVLDSNRDDVDYENWHGHDLDRELLELLQAY